MQTIILKSPSRATKAGNWAKRNIKSDWNINLGNWCNGNPTYEFIFADPQEATIFALRWL